MLDFRQKLAVNQRRVAIEKFDGDFVAIDLLSGKYFAFSGAGNLLIESLIQGYAIADMLAVSRSAECSHSNELEEFFCQIVDHELFVEDTTSAPSEVGPDWLNALSAFSQGPALDVYDDLADLILADPIHEADETAGWPHQRAV